MAFFRLDIKFVNHGKCSSGEPQLFQAIVCACPCVCVCVCGQFFRELLRERERTIIILPSAA